jgi:hypothetical protein
VDTRIAVLAEFLGIEADAFASVVPVTPETEAALDIMVATLIPAHDGKLTGAAALGAIMKLVEQHTTWSKTREIFSRLSKDAPVLLGAKQAALPADLLVALTQGLLRALTQDELEFALDYYRMLLFMGGPTERRLECSCGRCLEESHLGNCPVCNKLRCEFCEVEITVGPRRGVVLLHRECLAQVPPTWLSEGEQ